MRNPKQLEINSVATTALLQYICFYNFSMVVMSDSLV